LCGLFHAGAHALHHATHDQESNGGEGKHLCQPDAKHAIKPAPRLDAEGPLQPLVEQARTAKQQDQAQPHHKGRCDDGQHGQNVERFGQSRAATLGPQGQQSAHDGGASGREESQPQGVPGHAAAAFALHTAQTPNPLCGHALKQMRPSISARIVHPGRHQRTQDRVHHKQQQQRRAAHHRSSHKHIAPKTAQTRQRSAQKHQQAEQYQRGPPAHAVLANRQGAPHRFQRCKSPARGPNGKTTAQQPQQARQAAQQQQGTLLAGRPGPHDRQGAAAQAQRS